MAEFCLDCFNKHFNENLSSSDVVLAEEFCEGCSQIKPCVMTVLPDNPFERLFLKLFLKNK